MARSLAPERLPVDVVAELDEEDRLVYKRLLVADEAEAVRAAWVAELQSSQQRECAAESAADTRRKRRAADEARASSSDEEARVSAKRAVEASASSRPCCSATSRPFSPWTEAERPGARGTYLTQPG